jgi:hypothetical protein
MGIEPIPLSYKEITNIKGARTIPFTEVRGEREIRRWVFLFELKSNDNPVSGARPYLVRTVNAKIDDGCASFST